MNGSIELERAKRIQEAIKDLELTVEEFAREIRVDVKTVRRWVNEGRKPRFYNLRAISDRTGKPISYFTLETEAESASEKAGDEDHSDEFLDAAHCEQLAGDLRNEAY